MQRHHRRENTQEKIYEVTRRIDVVYRSIADLKADPANPRVHSRGQIRQIARSVKAFGFNVPVLVDSNLKVIAGHGRIRACKQLGLNEVPTIRLEHLPWPKRTPL